MTSSVSTVEVALRLALVVVLCGAIGLEREAHEHPAGVRTTVLVGMGAAVFTLISAYGFAALEARPGHVGVDPSRVAAQVVSGVGFLGAGAIIHQGAAIRGLTTAAALWIAAAIGMAAAIGFYTLAVAGTVLVLVALLVFRRIRERMRRRGSRGHSAAPPPARVSWRAYERGPGWSSPAAGASSPTHAREQVHRVADTLHRPDGAERGVVDGKIDLSIAGPATDAWDE